MSFKIVKMESPVWSETQQSEQHQEGSESSSALDGYMTYHYSTPLESQSPIIAPSSMKLSPGSADTVVDQDHLISPIPLPTCSPYANSATGMGKDSNQATHLDIQTGIDNYLNLSTIYDFGAEELNTLPPPLALPYLEPGNEPWGSSALLLQEPSQLVLYESPAMFCGEYGGVGSASGPIASSLYATAGSQNNLLLMPRMKQAIFSDVTTSKQDFSSFIPLNYSGNNINMNIPVGNQSVAPFQSETTNRATYLPHLILPRTKQMNAEYVAPSTPFTNLSTYQLDYTPKRIEKPIEDVVKQMTKKWEKSYVVRPATQIFDATTTNQESFINFHIRKAPPCPAKRALEVKEKGKLKNGHFFFKQKQIHKVC
uniref:Uncharacterized protein n=1 Tax=Ditylenchus dipsaci TaxID=166011 RepID=A0A915EQP8_9BILA